MSSFTEFEPPSWECMEHKSNTVWSRLMFYSTLAQQYPFHQVLAGEALRRRQ